ISLPNCTSHQKSTFFNVLTNSQASAENFPFCTIDPNESRVPVPDERFDFLCQYHKPARKDISIVNIAVIFSGECEVNGVINLYYMANKHMKRCS
ncbi:hypothetical protein FD755_008029, partial [Muntiacus reevesi]